MQLKKETIPQWSKPLLKITELPALRKQIAHWKQQQQRIAFVPTMGNLHQGHLALIEAAKQQADKVCCSIFINPMQFGEGEDFAAYPRTPEADQQKLMAIQTDCLFEPSVDLIYPSDLSNVTKVEVPHLSHILCGASRAGHFVGVTTIVCKLFNMVNPDIALFGKKDFQQLFILRRMVADLNIPIKIIGIDTIRETDGLAMSSRNRYLTVTERKKAPFLYQILQETAQRLSTATHLSALQQEMQQRLTKAGFNVDYFEIRDAATLAPAQNNQIPLVILVAAKLNRTRLIDNLEFQPQLNGLP